MKKLLLTGLCVCLLLGLCACGGPRYKVDYGGRMDSYTGAKASYRPGQTVVLYYEFIATDTDYSFYLDGKPLRYTYDESKGFRIEFTMPEHDVKLECRSVNSMDYDPSTGTVTVPDELAMRFEYTRVEIDPAGTSASCIRVYDYDVDLAFLEVVEPGSVPMYYVVPDTIIAECDSLVQEYGMERWNTDCDEIPYPASGVYTYRSLKCVDAGQSFIADVTHMPENGSEALDKVEALLRSYARDEYLINEP